MAHNALYGSVSFTMIRVVIFSFLIGLYVCASETEQCTDRKLRYIPSMDAP